MSTQVLAELIETVHRLRAPGGCPWDRAQTHQTLRQYLIEEAYEVLDVLDRIQDASDLKKNEIRYPFQEELGDLLMQVLIHSELAREEGAFDIYAVAQGLNEKLIRRHPHVFGETKADSVDSALSHWEKQKAKEKEAKKDASVLDGVPRGLPSLQKAARVIEKVTKVGFQWNDMQGPLEKMEEELKEMKTEVLALEKATKQKSPDVEELRKRVEDEMGDVIFTIANVASLLKINPEDALRSTLKRFEDRFKIVEIKLKEIGKTPDQSNLEEMDQFWTEAKAELYKEAKAELKTPAGQLKPGKRTAEAAFPIWGLTGGIASGKSTVATILRENGIAVLDADDLARELSSPGGLAHDAIVQRFGTADRLKLREIVFKDPQAKKDLESILHPLIRAESFKRMAKLAEMKSEGQARFRGAVVYEAALLVETGNYKDLAGLIVVDAPASVRKQRLIERNKFSPELADRMIKAQASDAERRKAATVLIENTGTVEELTQKVRDFLLNQGW